GDARQAVPDLYCRGCRVILQRGLQARLGGEGVTGGHRAGGFLLRCVDGDVPVGVKYERFHCGLLFSARSSRGTPHSLLGPAHEASSSLQGSGTLTSPTLSFVQRLVAERTGISITCAGPWVISRNSVCQVIS